MTFCIYEARQPQFLEPQPLPKSGVIEVLRVVAQAAVFTETFVVDIVCGMAGDAIDR